MEQPQTENNAADGLAEAEKYLREEADFNRSWTDGRRGAGTTCCTEEYKARRLEIARQREEWADAIAYAITALADNTRQQRRTPRHD